MAGMRGIGWVILAHDKKEGKLFNVWVNEHDCGLLAGATPLLVMDG
jgi:Fe-Mn family superoxide dismutase